jgi:hydrogenase maturation protease
MAEALVIAIGNPLRSDDGLAWRVADELRHDLGVLNAEIRAVHQLTPELAEPLAQVGLVVFIDAAARGEPGTLLCEELSAADESSGFSHALTPQSLLALAGRLYGKKPKAFLVSVAGKSFEHGESLSPEVQEALPALLTRVRELLRSEA